MKYATPMLQMAEHARVNGPRTGDAPQLRSGCDKEDCVHGLVNTGSKQTPVSLPMGKAVGVGVFAAALIEAGAPIFQCRGKVTYDEPATKRDKTHSVKAMDTHHGTYWVRAQGQFSEVTRPQTPAHYCHATD